MENREALQKILEEDCYYPNFATHEVREFSPKLVSERIVELAGKTGPDHDLSCHH